MADAFIAVLVIEINSDRTSYHDQCSYHPTLFLTPHSDILKTDNAPCFGQTEMRETPFSDQEFFHYNGKFSYTITQTVPIPRLVESRE